MPIGVGALHEGLGANGLLDGLRESGVFPAPPPHR